MAYAFSGRSEISTFKAFNDLEETIKGLQEFRSIADLHPSTDAGS
jgi:hypothetical protein